MAAWQSLMCTDSFTQRCRESLSLLCESRPALHRSMSWLGWTQSDPTTSDLQGGKSASHWGSHKYFCISCNLGQESLKDSRRRRVSCGLAGRHCLGDFHSPQGRSRIWSCHITDSWGMFAAFQDHACSVCICSTGLPKGQNICFRDLIKVEARSETHQGFGSSPTDEI